MHNPDNANPDRDTTPIAHVERLADIIHKMLGARIVYRPWQFAGPSEQDEILLQKAGEICVVTVKAGDRRQAFEVSNLGAQFLALVKILSHQTGFEYREVF
jgi:hypothetical protein